jgi:hypothetical protein
MDQQSPEYFEEHAVHVARVIFAAAMLDDLVSTFIAEFLDLEEFQENALLRPMGTRAKIDLLQRLSNHYVGRKETKSINSLFAAARDALEERNAVVHGIPSQIDGAFAFRSWTGKAKLTGEPDLWPVERVCALAGRFIWISDAFQTLLDGFQGLKASDAANRAPDD